MVLSLNLRVDVLINLQSFVNNTKDFFVMNFYIVEEKLLLLFDQTPSQVLIAYTEIYALYTYTFIIISALLDLLLSTMGKSFVID